MNVIIVTIVTIWIEIGQWVMLCNTRSLVRTDLLIQKVHYFFPFLLLFLVWSDSESHWAQLSMAI
jgi:hypothetical protein